MCYLKYKSTVQDIHVFYLLGYHSQHQAHTLPIQHYQFIVMLLFYKTDPSMPYYISCYSLCKMYTVTIHQFQDIKMSNLY